MTAILGTARNGGWRAWRWIGVLLVLGCSGVPGVLRAAVEMPVENGRPVPLPTKVLQRDGEDWKVWVAYDRYRPRVKWLDEAAPNGLRFLKFLEPLYVLYDHQGPEGDYLLLGEADSNGSVRSVVGWVRKDIIVLGPESQKEQATGVHRKVMLITRETVLKDTGGKFEDSVPFRHAPQTEAAPKDRFQLYNIFFVYGQTRPSVPGKTDDVYVLLGNDQYFSERSTTQDPTKVVLGWVPWRHITRWNTREAILWDRESTLDSAKPRRTTPGRFFATVQAARALLDGKLADADAATLFREVLDQRGLSKVFAPHHMRYPLLEFSSGELTVDGAEFPRQYRGNELLKVGAIGGFAGLTPGEIEDLRRQLERINQQISATELLFVIDDTGSMYQYFDDVAKLVSRISSQAANSSRLQRVAVAFYNDTDEKDPQRNPVVFPQASFPLRDVSSHGRQIEQTVATHNAVSGGDRREQLYRGLQEAILNAKFSTWARKLVIVIGDCGDKTDRKGDETQEAQLAELFLPPGQSPIELFAVHVGNTTEDEHAKAFGVQMNSVVRLLNERAAKAKPDVRRTLGSYRKASDDSLEGALRERYDELAREAEAIRSNMENVRAGKFQTEIGPEYDAILRRAGIDLTKLRNQQGVQLFREGFVWRYSTDPQRPPQVRMQLLLERSTVESLVKIMGRLTGQRRELIGGKITVKEALTALINDAVGDRERDPHASFEEAVMKRLGLVARSPLLKKRTNAEFNLKLVEDDLVELAHRVERMQDLLDKKERTWVKKEVEEAGRKVTKYEGGPAREYDRSFTLPNSNVRWYWLDVETELP